MDIGRRIIELREIQDLSTNRLAKIADVAQSHLRDIELGKKQPGIDVLERLCDALGLTLVDFFSDDNAGISAEMLRLINAAAKLKPEQLEHLIKFIDVMAREK
jgi:HTH-type transcriptional repressor of puuD